LKVYEKRINKLVNNEKLAKKIIRTLLQGVSESINDDKTLDDLIHEVSSKKGTTEAAIKELKKLHFLKNFDAGIKAALIRAKEMSEN
ncbi:MAG: pyrroline-5-carboxylate reductase dimerization domain-containing protein, partial [Gammaproteobacteria bacterium]